MSKASQIAIVIGLLLGGIIIGRSPTLEKLAPRTNEDTDYKAKYEQLRDKLSHLNDVDFQEYMDLKDQKQKYLKADEILGKMILIFLADLGLNVSAEKVELAEKMIGRPLTPEDLRPVEADTTGNVPAPMVKEAAPPAVPLVLKSHLKQREKGLEDINSEDQAKKFLDSVIVDDLYELIRAAKPLKNEQIQSITGLFSGKVTFDDKTQDPWDVEMSLDGFLQEKEPSGSFEVKLFKLGEAKPFSHSHGEGGELRHANSVGDSQAMLINANGDSGLFQLYAPKKLNMLVGNYYGKSKGSSSFAKQGTVILQKR